MISQARRNELGNALEDLVDKALSRFVPFSDIEYERREKIDGDVDFYIKENDTIKIAMECKNWKQESVQNSWIEREILPRFDKVTDNVIKFVVGNVNVTKNQWKKYFKKKGIFLHQLSRQIQPEDNEAIKEVHVEYLMSQLALLIVGQTGKFREDFLSKTTVKLIGGKEVIFDFEGEPKHWNLKTDSNLASQSFGNYYSKMVQFGPKPLDFVSSVWFRIDNYNCMIIPRSYTITQNSVPHFDSSKLDSHVTENNKIMSYLGELPQEIQSDAKAEFLRQLGFGEAIEAAKAQDNKAKLYGYDIERGGLSQFFKIILWKQF